MSSSLLLAYNLLAFQPVREDDAYIINMALSVIVIINRYGLLLRCTYPAGTKEKHVNQ